MAGGKHDDGAGVSVMRTRMAGAGASLREGERDAPLDQSGAGIKMRHWSSLAQGNESGT